MNCLKVRFDYIKNRFEAKQLKHFIDGIYKHDHWPSYKNFHKTANWVAKELKNLGLESKVIEFPADGKTEYGDWTMPMAWDAHSAKLIDKNTGITLVDYEETPACMVMESSSLPNGGTEAELVYIDKAQDLKETDFRNKFLLTGFNPESNKTQIIENGGLAVFFMGQMREDQNDGIRWHNSWSESGMWRMIKGETECPALTISGDQVQDLKTRLEDGEKVILEAHITTEFYDGTLPVVEAFLPGQTIEEVFLTGHLYEQGANDNASGAATMMEIARIFSGTKPKRGIRFLFTSEIYGTIPYCHENLGILQNSIAGMNIDSTAELGRISQKMDVIKNPDTNPSFVNLLVEEIIKATNQNDQFAFQNFLLDDNLVTDPHIDIPCVLMGVCSKNHHTSYDTMDILDWDLFNNTTIHCASWVDAVANGGKAEALLLQTAMEEFLKEWETKIRDKKLIAQSQNYLNDYINETKNSFRKSINHIEQVYDIEESNYFDDESLKRQYFGNPCYNKFDTEKRNKIGLGMWSSSGFFPLYLANGRRKKERIASYLEIGSNLNYEATLNKLDGLIEENYLQTDITKSSLMIDLRRIGIKKGDIINVHSSFKKIGGSVIGGPLTVIESILEIIGEEGTLVMPCFNNLDQEKIDLRTCPSRLGIISETFRTYPGVRRSNNPTHSICAIGKHSIEILQNHEKTTQLGLDSPLHKLAKLNGKILHLGTDITTNSLIHVAEVIAKAPYLHISYNKNSGPITYTNDQGKEIIFNSQENPGDSQGFTKILKKYDLSTISQECIVGMADSILYDAKSLLEYAVKMCCEDPYSILCDNPNCTVCPPSKACKQDI